MQLEKLTFALLGDPHQEGMHQLLNSNYEFEGPEFERSYSSRTSASVTLDGESSFREATLQATAVLADRDPAGDYSRAGEWTAFFSSGDETGIRHGARRLSKSVNLVDPDDRLRWHGDPGDATVELLIHSSDVGALAGDARRPYLVVGPSDFGDGLLGEWADVVRAWEVFAWMIRHLHDAVIEPAVNLLTVPLLYDEYRRRASQRIAGIFRDNESQWIDRGAAPSDPGTWIDEQARSQKDVARLLGIPPEDAEDLLLARGFERRESGMWVPAAATDSLARIVRHLDYSDSQDEETIKYRIGRLLDDKNPWGDD